MLRLGPFFSIQLLKMQEKRDCHSCSEIRVKIKVSRVWAGFRIQGVGFRVGG